MCTRSPQPFAPALMKKCPLVQKAPLVQAAVIALLLKQPYHQLFYNHYTIIFIGKLQRLLWHHISIRTLYQKFKTYIPRLKLHGLVPNFYIHVSGSDLYIPTIGPWQSDPGNI
jgi:hypothetical protein